MKKIIILTILGLVASSTFAAEVKTTETALENNQVQVAAQVDIKANWKERVRALKEEKKQLIADVKAGKISKEDAKKTWEEKISKLRAEKESFFEARLQKIEARKERLSEIAPEIATRIEKRINAMKNKRRAVLEIRTQINSGKISKEDAREKFRSIRENFKAERKIYQDEFKTERAQIRKIFFDKIGVMKEDAKKEQSKARAEFNKIKKDADPELKVKLDANKQILMDLKTDVKAGKVSKEDAKEKFQVLRKERKEMVHSVKEDIKAQRKEIFKNAKEKREAVRNEFQNRKAKREEVKEVNLDFGFGTHKKKEKKEKTGARMNFGF